MDLLISLCQGYTWVSPPQIPAWLGTVLLVGRPLLSMPFTPTSRFLLSGSKPCVSPGSSALQPQLLWLSALCDSIKNALQLSSVPWLSLQLCYFRWLSGKESACDAGLIPVWGRSPGEGNGNPLHYSCLGNPMDRGAWRATVHGVTTELNLVTKQQQQHHYSGGFLLCKSGSLQPVA